MAAHANADLGLYLAIGAAANDLSQRECPWYAVWNICLNHYLFAHSNTQTTACSTIPQYSLVWTYDVDTDHNTTPSSHSSSSASDHMRVSPLPQHLQLSKRSFKIPDFVQVLHRAIQPQEFPPNHIQQRVILTVEVKPALEAATFDRILQSQVAKQVMYAFSSDHTLQSLGVVLPAGLYWVYHEVDRPPSCELEYLERTIYDSDYVPQVENSTDTESNNSGSSVLSDPPDVLFHIPECIDSILDGRRQISFDDVPLCKQALVQIASHLKAFHSQFWGLQGDGKCTTCAAVAMERRERVSCSIQVSSHQIRFITSSLHYYDSSIDNIEEVQNIQLKPATAAAVRPDPRFERA
ncbi:hypothetical protein EDD22DRAFT_1053037 [Suillus occidentalis]|nr:hypothetical protein EDD22DRAFT_1053037 [Suillus occidentalis]